MLDRFPFARVAFADAFLSVARITGSGACSGAGVHQPPFLVSLAPAEGSTLHLRLKFDRLTP